jgi:SAM-dependent methyltransferase
MPLANALLTDQQLEQREPHFPLDLVFCPTCSLAQITETVSPELLFGNYLYFSSFSVTFLRHAQELADRLVVERHLNSTSRVIEVASNDGYLLQYYRERGIPVLGIEPAENVARVARDERRVPTLCEFFGEDLARRLRDGGERADIIHAHNVLAHVADLNGFVAGLKLLLKDDGIAIVEVPYVKEMVDRCEFDTIYHEHLCYFSMTALDALFERHGLSFVGVERLGIHGGSLRLFASPSGAASYGASVQELIEEESDAGLLHVPYYEAFAARCHALLAELRGFLAELHQRGDRLAAYGAAAKGTVLLNALGLEPGTISFVADRSPHKQGRYMPGVRVPIVPPSALLAEQPDHVLILAWNLAEEVLAQQAEYRARGGRFIVPLPHPRLV